MVPQRVTPERHEAVVEQTRKRQPGKGTFYPGSDEFEASIDAVPEEKQSELRRLLKWARGLERRNLVKLGTYRGVSGRYTLLPRIQPENVGLVTIWNEKNSAYLSFWRSVFEKKAPDFIERVEELIHPKKLGQGNTAASISDELLKTLKAAYKAAAANS